jgi:hypothetical protein
MRFKELLSADSYTPALAAQVQVSADDGLDIAIQAEQQSMGLLESQKKINSLKVFCYAIGLEQSSSGIIAQLDKPVVQATHSVGRQR